LLLNLYCLILHFVAYRAINLKFNLARRLNRGLAAMTSYSTVDNVKPILRIALDDLTYDLELEECIASADAIIDSELLKHSLSMPDTVPQNIADASAHFAAWLFRHRRAPAEAAAFWDEANRFLNTYLETAKEALFRVVSDQ